MRAYQKVSKGYIVSGFIFGLILALLVFIFSYVFLVINRINYDGMGANITPETGLENLDVPDNMAEGMAIPLMSNDGIWNVLLIGVDRRSDAEHGRSDAMMLLTGNDNTDKFHITSLMRAIYVSIPNEPDPEYAPYYSENYMLNAAHAWGGPTLLVKTVQRNFRVDVQHYIEIDFNGFESVIDAIGGIHLDLSEAEAAYISRMLKRQVDPGYQLVDGKVALMYSRTRYIDDDFERTSRQRTVIETLIRELRTGSIPELTRTFEAVAPHLTTNMTRGQIMGLILEAPRFLGYEIDQLMLPLETYDAMTYINGMEMYDIDWEANVSALHDFMRK